MDTTIVCVECGQECRPDDSMWLYQHNDRSRPIHHHCNLKVHYSSPQTSRRARGG